MWIPTYSLKTLNIMAILGKKIWKLAYGQNFHEYLLCEAVVKIWVNSFIHLEPTVCQSLF